MRIRNRELGGIGVARLWSLDPAGEFLNSLDVVDQLDVQHILSGHGRPVRGARELTAANRRAVAERMERIRRSLAGGPRPAFDLVPEMLDAELPGPMMIGWGLTEALCYLNHLQLRGEVEKIDGEETESWRLIAAGDRV